MGSLMQNSAKCHFGQSIKQPDGAVSKQNSTITGVAQMLSGHLP